MHSKSYTNGKSTKTKEKGEKNELEILCERKKPNEYKTVWAILTTKNIYNRMERMAAVGDMVKHDPKSQKCTHCECSWTPRTHHKILMLLLGKYSWTCPRCGAVMTYRLINHVVKVDSKKVLNERIWENG